MALGAAGAAPARAYVLQGHPWPGHVITYHNDFRADAAAVASAAHDWNSSGADIRFVAVPAKRAEVTISAMPARFVRGAPGTEEADVLGYASVGMVPRSAPDGPLFAGYGYHGAHVWLARIGSRDALGAKISLGSIKRVAVHELGHVLGLGHETRVCAIMQPTLNDGCGITHPWIGLCSDPLQPDDIRGAVALYDGRRPRGGSRLCVISPRPLAPRGLGTVLGTAGSGSLTLRWRNPPGVAVAPGPLDPYSFDGRATVSAYEIDGSQHGCPALGKDVLQREPAHPGRRMKVALSLASGPWCLRVRIADAFGRWGRPATARLSMPAPVPPVASFQIDPAQPIAGAGVAFYDRSSGGSAPVASWYWTFGDGSTSTVENPTHTYVATGTYTVTLRITDNDGRSATASEQLTVG